MKKRQTNVQFLKENKEFLDCCAKIKFQPTLRQVSKFRNKQGKVWNSKN